jgi:myosin-1
MGVIGLSQEEQTEIFRMLAVILWIGNVQFDEKEDGNSTVADTDVTDFVAYLMEVDSALVPKVLTSKIVETQRGGRRGSVYDVPLNPSQATSVRDALAKAIYNNLFEWIVSRINVSMKPRAASAHIVGILVCSNLQSKFLWITVIAFRISSDSKYSKSVPQSLNTYYR